MKDYFLGNVNATQNFGYALTLRNSNHI